MAPTDNGDSFILYIAPPENILEMCTYLDEINVARYISLRATLDYDI
jgi:hypothetical protein